MGSFDVCFAMLGTRKKLFSLVGLIGARSLASSSTTFKKAEISQFLSERIVERKNGKKEKDCFLTRSMTDVFLTSGN